MKKKYYYTISKILAFFAFIYTLIKATILSLTHDEAITYVYHVVKPYKDIFFFNTLYSSTNQLLNTILIKFFVSVFGNSELVNRIPGLIGHVIYLIAIYLVLKLFLKDFKFMLGYTFMIFHPMMLDFFSMARGYSFAYGFLTLVIYYFFRYIKEPNKKYIFYISLLASFSVLSYLVYLNVFATTLILLFLYILLNKKNKSKLNSFLLIIPSVIILLLFVYKPITDFGSDKLITYGGSNGFWQDSVFSLIEFTLYGRNLSQLFIIFFKILIILTLLIGIFVLFKRKPKLIDKYHLLILLFLVLLGLLNIFQHIVLSMDYLSGRHAVFYLPFFFLLILILWQKSKNLILTHFISFVLLILLIHYFTSLNTEYYFTWSQDAPTKEAMNLIEELSKNENKEISVGISWFFEPTVNYYLLKNNLTWIKSVNREGPEGHFDYYYVLAEDLNSLNEYNLTLVKEFELSKTYLFAQNK